MIKYIPINYIVDILHYVKIPGYYQYIKNTPHYVLRNYSKKPLHYKFRIAFSFSIIYSKPHS